MMRLLTLTLALLLVTVGTAHATTYYVATTGNDANPGTQSQPFLTIQKGANVVNPGDTVIVQDGTYVDRYIDGYDSIVRVRRGGDATHWITFKSENPLGAKMDGQSSTIMTGWYIEAGYVRIEGFEIYGTKAGGITGFSSHVEVVGNHFHDIGRYCDSNGTIGKSGVYAINVVDWTVEKNIFHDIGRFDTTEGGCTPTTPLQLDHGLYISSVDTITIKNNIFYNIYRGYPIHFYNGSSQVPSTNVKILNNTFSGSAPHTSGGHIVLATPSVNNALIANNIFYQPKNSLAIYYYNLTMSNVQVQNNITYQGMISALYSGVSFSGNRDYTDPHLVSPSTHDFHLQTGSPAIDAGVSTTPTVTEDFDGIARPQGAIDIGAFESSIYSDGGGTVDLSSGSTGNLALNKPAVASSSENSTLYPAAKAFDGNATTRWSSAHSDPQWIYVDLGANYTVTGVKLVWEAAYARAFKIQASTDAVTWADIYSTTTGPGGIQTLTVAPTTARYIRMYGTLRATPWGYSLWEMEVYGTATTSTGNLALNKPAVASSSENSTLYPAAKAFDGNATTRWSSAFSDPQWIYVDLGANYMVDGVKLVWEAAYARAFKIQASTDAVTWADIYSTTTGPGGIQTLTVAPTTARYIRMYGTARATYWGYSLWEMEVYGH